MNELRPRFEKNLARALVAILFLGCLLVVWPFATALLWATILSFSVWPLYRRCSKVLGGRQTLAAFIICAGMIMAVLLPFAVVGFTLGENVDELKTAARRWLDSGPPAAPAWLEKVPLVGHSATETWNNFASDTARFAEKAKEMIEPMAA